MAPNGVAVGIVWRPLTSGRRYHGTRNAGIQKSFDMTPEQLRDDQDPVPAP